MITNLIHKVTRVQRPTNTVAGDRLQELRSKSELAEFLHPITVCTAETEFGKYQDNDLQLRRKQP